MNSIPRTATSESQWAPLARAIDGFLGGLLAGCIVVGLALAVFFGAGHRGDHDEYRFHATIGNSIYTMKVDVVTPVPIDPTVQHGIIFAGQQADGE